MAVTAKMQVGHIEELHASARRVKLFCVWDSNPESPNFEWSMATPAGSVELVITNPAAFEQFETGKQFMVTFDSA